MNSKIVDGAAIFATILGTAKVIGLLSGVWILNRAGETFAISPAPSPYDRVPTQNGLDVSVGSAFGCEDERGQISWHRWNYEVRGEVPGPHRRGVTFLAYFGQLGRARSEYDLQRVETLTKFYFCEDKTLARAAACKIPLKAVHLREFIPSDEKDLRIACTP